MIHRIISRGLRSLPRYREIFTGSKLDSIGNTRSSVQTMCQRLKSSITEEPQTRARTYCDNHYSRGIMRRMAQSDSSTQTSLMPPDSTMTMVVSLDSVTTSTPCLARDEPTTGPFLDSSLGTEFGTVLNPNKTREIVSIRSHLAIEVRK